MSDKLLNKIRKANKTFDKITDLSIGIMLKELTDRSLLLEENSEEDKIYNEKVFDFFFDKIMDSGIDFDILYNVKDFKSDEEIVNYAVSKIVEIIDKEEFKVEDEELNEEQLEEYNSFGFDDRNDIHFPDK